MGLSAPYLNFRLHLVFLLSWGFTSTETLRIVGDGEPWMATWTYREREILLQISKITVTASLHMYHCWAVQWSWFAWVNALCNLSCKKSLLGWFLSRRCFMLCITMEVEPRIVKQYKCHHCCTCKNYQGKGMEGGKKVSLCHFWTDQKIAISLKKLFWGIL